MSSESRKLKLRDAQVRLLADRLAIAVAMISDAEIDAWLLGWDCQPYQAERGALIYQDEAHEALREKWRESPCYAESLAFVRAMLASNAVRVRKENVADAA